MKDGVGVKLVTVEDLRLTDRNKAGGDGVFDCDGRVIRAELIYYLQGYQCLSLKLGRHDTSVSTDELERYLAAHQIEMRDMVKADVERLKKERQARLSYQD